MQSPLSFSVSSDASNLANNIKSLGDVNKGMCRVFLAFTNSGDKTKPIKGLFI